MLNVSFAFVQWEKTHKSSLFLMPFTLNTLSGGPRVTSQWVMGEDWKCCLLKSLLNGTTDTTPETSYPHASDMHLCVRTCLQRASWGRCYYFSQAVIPPHLLLFLPHSCSSCWVIVAVMHVHVCMRACAPVLLISCVGCCEQAEIFFVYLVIWDPEGFRTHADAPRSEEEGVRSEWEGGWRRKGRMDVEAGGEFHVHHGLMTGQRFFLLFSSSVNTNNLISILLREFSSSNPFIYFSPIKTDFQLETSD